MPRKKSPLTPPVSRRRAYELPNLVRVNVPQDPIMEIENQNLRDLSNEYRVLRLEEMLSKKRQQISKGPTSGIQVQKDNLELFKLFAEIQKLSRPPESADKTLEYLKYFNTVMQNQGAPGFFEQYEKARQIGIVGSPNQGEPNQFSVDLEKIRNERMLASKKFDLELLKMRLQQEDGQNKLGLLAQILAPVAAYSGAKMSEDMRARGVNTASRIMNPDKNVFTDLMEQSGIINPGSLQGKTGKMLISCDCGFSESMLVPIPPPEQISCPKCGKTLNTAPHSGDEEETRSEWSDHQ